MHDGALQRIRETFHERVSGHGHVDQVRTAGRLFAGDYSAAATVSEEFDGSILGLGVMHDIAGEVVSLGGHTWRVPVTGVPIPVGPHETVAFGVAAHGGRRHRVNLDGASDVEATLTIIDTYLEQHHINPESVVCAVEIHGSFSDVVLRTVSPPRYEGETLGEIIDDESRFSFDSWVGTMVGFRFPDNAADGAIPGIHLHGIADDRQSGGHLRNMVTVEVSMNLWVDELHPVHDATGGDLDAVSIDFARYEGPVVDPG
jgi:acetolactate decarboxylase